MEVHLQVKVRRFAIEGGSDVAGWDVLATAAMKYSRSD
jgi:hypothetical protein